MIIIIDYIINHHIKSPINMYIFTKQSDKINKIQITAIKEELKPS